MWTSAYSQLYAIENDSRYDIGIQSYIPTSTFSKYISGSVGLVFESVLGKDDLQRFKFYDITQVGIYFPKQKNWDNKLLSVYMMPFSGGLQYENDKFFIGGAIGPEFIFTRKERNNLGQVVDKGSTYVAVALMPRAGFFVKKFKFSAQYNLSGILEIGSSLNSLSFLLQHPL